VCDDRRQRVDTLGVLANEGSLNPSCNVCPRAGDQSIPKATSVTSHYVSTLCLPDVMHVTKSFRPPPSIFALASNPVGKAWEQGFYVSLSTSLCWVFIPL